MIYDQNNKKVRGVDVGYFAQVYGDGICQSHENYKTCRRDCLSGGKDDYCDAVKDNICNPDCFAGVDPDCEIKEEEERGGLMAFLPYLGFLFIILILITFFFFYRKSK